MKKILLSIFFSFVIALSFVSSTFAAPAPIVTGNFPVSGWTKDEINNVLKANDSDLNANLVSFHSILYVDNAYPNNIFYTAALPDTNAQGYPTVSLFQDSMGNSMFCTFYYGVANRVSAVFNSDHTFSVNHSTSADYAGNGCHVWDTPDKYVVFDINNVFYPNSGPVMNLGYLPWSYDPIIVTPPIVDPAIFNSSFLARYNGLSVDFTATATPGGQPTDVKITNFLWKFEGENDTFTDVTDIEQHAVGDSGYFYSSEAHHDYTNPGDYNVYLTVMDENHQSKTFHQLIKVSSTGQGTFYGNAETDTSSSDIACDQSDFMSRLICTTQKQFKIGLINPSINAVKNIFSALIVSDSPACGFTLMDLTIVPGEVFPLSQLSTVVCTRVDQIRTAFPVVPVLINFALAYLLLRLIITIINRLLDHTKTDIIEGIK